MIFLYLVFDNIMNSDGRNGWGEGGGCRLNFIRCKLYKIRIQTLTARATTLFYSCKTETLENIVIYYYFEVWKIRGEVNRCVTLYYSIGLALGDRLGCTSGCCIVHVWYRIIQTNRRISKKNIRSGFYFWVCFQIYFIFSFVL